MSTTALIKGTFFATGVASQYSHDAEASIPRAYLPVQNQARCGSCWSFSGTEQLSMRILLTNQEKSFEGYGSVVSPQVPVSFPQYSHSLGCNGGNPYYVGLMAQQEHGLPDIKCAPYVSGNCNEGQDKSGNGCTRETWGQCWGSSRSWTQWGAYQGARIVAVRQLQGEAAYKDDILQHGDLSVGFNVMREFETYRGGVLSTATGPSLGGHAVLITGWGGEGGVPYWKIRNSWGSNWGEQGYFRMIRGRNFQTIEQTGVSFILSTSSDLSETQNDTFVPTFVPPEGSDMPGAWVERPITDEPVAEAVAVYQKWAGDSSVELVAAASQVVEGLHVSLHVRTGGDHKKVLAHRPPVYSDSNGDPTFSIISVDDAPSDFVVV